MNQHSVQEAYLKSFRDPLIGKVWVYPKDGQPKFSKPTNWCTAEDDFQSELLEREQNELVESPAIKALRSVVSERPLSDPEYQSILEWTVLHLIRNQKMRGTLVKPGENYENQFPSEFKKELLHSFTYYKFARVYTCTGADYFVTSDNPISECCFSGDYVRFLVLTPQKLIQLSPRDEPLVHEQESFEMFVNALIWADADRYLFSHRDDVDVSKYKSVAEKWGMEPRLENQTWLIKGNPEVSFPNFSTFK